MNEFQFFINGQSHPSSTGTLDENINPATGEAFALVHQSSEEDVELAINNAHEAFQTWKEVPAAKREGILLKAADLITEHGAELRELLTTEGGATQLKAGYEVSHAPDFIRSMAGEARRVMGETYPSNYPGVFSYSIRRPLGVIGAISPFNFPLLLSVRKIGWALAAGNCVVLKPSDRTPVIGIKLAEIFHKAGLPAGVLNVVTGTGPMVGQAMIKSPKVKYMTFTGSSKIGKQVAADCALQMKRCGLELGGKNALIVLNDADIDYAVKAARFSNFMNQGQVCMTGSRVIVEQGVYDQFCEKMATSVGELKVGDPKDSATQVGPLITRQQAEFVKVQVEKAQLEGAELKAGGNCDGAFFEPTLLTGVTDQMSVFHTELFGPVMSVIKADDADHALELANNSEYGLSGAIITNNLQEAIRLSEQMETGMVHINGPTIRDEPVVPFGGVKNSGLGREGGHFSMDDVTEWKWVTIQKGQQQFPI